jgi:hypothetical protein
MMEHYHIAMFKPFAAFKCWSFQLASRVTMVAAFVGMIVMFMAMTPPSASANIKLVEVQAEGIGTTQRDAILDALKTAVGQINGMDISSQTISRLATQVIDTDQYTEFTASTEFVEDISSATSGQIDSFDIISSRVRPDFNNAIEVVLRVKVAKYVASKQLNRLRMSVYDPYLDASIASDPDAIRFARSLRRKVEDYLTQTRRFAMLDRQMLTDTQDELNLIANGGMPTSELARLGQRVGSDYLVMITVYEHGRIVNDRQLLGTTAIKRDVIDMAEVSVRIIDVATSQIKYAKNQIFQIDPAKAALDEHASFQLGQFISNAIYPAKIVAIDGAVLTIGQGGDTMQNGAEYHIVQQGERLADPYTKESIGRKETIIGIARITRVQSKQSTAEIISLDMNISAESSLILRPIYADPLVEAADAAQKMKDAKSKIQDQKNNFFEE